MVRGLLSAAALLAGCFGPQLDDVSCETTGMCPPGRVCVDDSCVPGPPGEACGDGVRDGGEACDDGNREDGDGCSADCSAARCTAPITHPTVQALVDDPACATGYLSPGRYFELVVIDRDVALEGVGFGDVVVDGDGFGRPIEVLEDRAVTLRGFAVRNGLAVAGGGIRNDGQLVLERMRVVGNLASDAAAAGGGIWHRLGTLTIRDSLIAGNRVEASGGGGATIGGGGGVLAEAPLVVEAGTRFEDNVVEVAGADTVARGGAIDARGADVVLDGCVLTGNVAEALAAPPAVSTAARGGAIAADGGASVTVTGCAVSGNMLFASGPTGALTARGGGVHVEGGALILGAGAALADNLVTLSGAGATTRGDGGGLFATGSAVSASAAALAGNAMTAVGQAPSDDVEMGAGGAVIELDGEGAEVALVNSTIARCSGFGLEIRDLGAAAGAVQLLNLTISANDEGLKVDRPPGAAASVTVASSLIAGNLGDECATAGRGLLGDFNLLGDDCDFAGNPQNNLVGVDPRLGPLGDNGGPTETFALGDGSPAIDAGAGGGCVDGDGAPLAVDQRGLPRPVGDRCDIGAVERQ